MIALRTPYSTTENFELKTRVSDQKKQELQTVNINKLALTVLEQRDSSSVTWLPVYLLVTF